MKKLLENIADYLLQFIMLGLLIISVMTIVMAFHVNIY